MRCLPALLTALAACSAFRGEQTLESSVILAAHGKATARMTGCPSLTVDLRGVGPGSVTFDACTSDGSRMAHGVLTAEACARCLTTDGELILTFAADEKGGTVAYTIRAQDGGSVALVPQ